ncbi:DUF5914 domain-containing protein [Streptomyces sp. NPDC018947]|uniref:DUF5914 domain-containing protein n=1 Tax=Streptomyces sp. NPDC018947 TaxID=3365054 RepID=UPI0037A50A60
MTPVERAPARPSGNRYVVGAAGDVRLAVRCGALVRLRHGPAPAPRPLTRAAAGRLWRDDLAHAGRRRDPRRRGPFPG